MSCDKDIQVNDLPEQLQEVANEIGLENTLKFAKLMSGMQLYIPVYEKICVSARNRALIKDYRSGKSAKELAKKYGVCLRTIYELIHSLT